jgi:ubiquinone/menaquinone biosynthesis C-methylase UbiE
MNEDTGLLNIWKQRAEKFNNIGWVTDYDLLRFLHTSLQLKGEQKILDAGIGTGVLAKFILNQSPEVKMYGLDSSKEMTDQINDERIIVRIGDLKNIPFVDNFFDRVVLRHVLHHCVGYTCLVIEEVRRILKPEGKIIICESIPISDDCTSDFSQIVTLKENRLVFTAENFWQMLFKFKDICAGSIILKQQSIKNWIDNCIEDINLKMRILDNHKFASETYKKAASMTETDNDILVDMKFIVVRGEK